MAMPEQPASIERRGLRRNEDEIVVNYFLKHAADFPELYELREKGWSNTDADKHFDRQRHTADNVGAEGQRSFYAMMKRNGEEMNASTGGLRIARIGTIGEPLRIVDFCMAPGGFLSEALLTNRGAHVRAFTLPKEEGGHKVLLPYGGNTQVNFVDITMLAEDMGVPINTIPRDHPDADKFLLRVFSPDGGKFDQAICDGQVLRTQIRASYREAREATRLISTQLALGLEHLRPGGTMIVLLHHLETWRTVQLLVQFSRFSTVQLFKPSASHATRSSFYLVASNIDPSSHEAVEAVRQWKDLWRIATFENDEAYAGAMSVDDSKVHEALNELGEQLIDWAKPMWKIQRDALVKMPWTK